MYYLDEIAKSIRKHNGIRRKKDIGSIVNFFNNDALASFGEDCAVIRNGKKVILFACDGIIESIVKKTPYLAGYFSILVNANDIASMGGKPLAAVNVLSYRNKQVLNRMLEGLAEGSKKFGVQIVGGHIHPQSRYDSISVSILGEGKLGHLLYSHTAKPKDDILFAIDTDGKFISTLEAFDTTTHKSSKQIKRRYEGMRRVAELSLSKCAKDISNAGTLGTLAMILELSLVGAKIDVRKIPKPKDAPLVKWLNAYQGCGFVLTCKNENSRELISLLEEAGFEVAKVGKITEDKRLVIEDEKEKKEVFNFMKEGITNLGKNRVRIKSQNQEKLF